MQRLYPDRTSNHRSKMTDELFKKKYRVRSTRLPGWDYSRSGYYFVTICTNDRACTFGEIENGRMTLTDIGKVADQCWRDIPDHFPFVQLDAFVIMPNHVHGIVVIVDAPANSDRRDVACNASTIRNANTAQFSRISPKQGSLSSVIRSYKSAVTRFAHRAHPNQAFRWQARFHDRIIRNEKELWRVRRYIQNNVLKWAEDQENQDMKREAKHHRPKSSTKSSRTG